MMSDKTWYWVAAGVLALGLSNSFENREIGSLQQVRDRVQAAENDFVTEASDQVFRALNVATQFSDREEVRSPQMQVALTKIQSRVACLQTLAAEKQAEMARREAEKAREEMFEKMRAEDLCPRQKLQTAPMIKVNELPDDDTI